MGGFERGVRDGRHQFHRAGDEIVVAGGRVGESPRKGEILEVLGVRDHAHYRVRWEDGRISVFFPAADTTVRRRQELVS